MLSVMSTAQQPQLHSLPPTAVPPLPAQVQLQYPAQPYAAVKQESASPYSTPPPPQQQQHHHFQQPHPSKRARLDSLPYYYYPNTAMSGPPRPPAAHGHPAATSSTTPTTTTTPTATSTSSSTPLSNPAVPSPVPPTPSMNDGMGSSSSNHHHNIHSKSVVVVDPVVTQALEIARESPDGASDPTISNILETALRGVWAKVKAAPESYVMTREEFSLFNFYQHRFVGDKDAVAARRRYWDSTCR